MTPTARSLKLLRDRQWLAAVVEHWNPYARVRHDLFGFIDIVAINPGQDGVLGIQATTTDNQASRMKKIEHEPRALIWIQAGNRVAVWGWAKQGARNQRKLWMLTVTELHLGADPSQPWFWEQSEAICTWQRTKLVVP